MISCRKKDVSTNAKGIGNPSLYQFPIYIERRYIRPRILI
ncbi:hypothetical protein MGA3_10140 [Bacillus methanolicus MGA3]|nr:hypothetical protein MGA3_10140 [Bacillus methanolicus MGA3]